MQYIEFISNGKYNHSKMYGMYCYKLKKDQAELKNIKIVNDYNGFWTLFKSSIGHWSKQSQPKHTPML